MAIKPIFLDIETISNKEHVKFLDPIKVPKTHKKPESIKEYKEKKAKEQYDKMALDIDHAQIVAIGYAIGFEHTPRVRLARSYEEEEKILRFIWRLLRTTNNPVVGWNVRSFDLNILKRRAWFYGIPIFKNVGQLQVRINDLNTDDRWSNRIVDLMERMYHFGYAPGSAKWRSLDKVCEMYDIPNAYPDLNGSMVKDMDNRTLIEYNKNDIRMTRQLAVATKGWYW